MRERHSGLLARPQDRRRPRVAAAGRRVRFPSPSATRWSAETRQQMQRVRTRSRLGLRRLDLVLSRPATPGERERLDLRPDRFLQGCGEQDGQVRKKVRSCSATGSGSPVSRAASWPTPGRVTRLAFGKMALSPSSEALRFFVLFAPPSSRTSQRAAANLSIGPARVRRPLARPGLRACIRACPPDGSRVLGGRRRVASIIGFTEIVRRPTQCPPTAASSRRPVPAAEENDASLPTSEPVGSTPRPRDIGYERATNVIADRSRLEVQDRVRAHREGAESNDGRRGGREPEAV